jgi:hypothetical protein
VNGANRHDMKLLCATLAGIVITRPEPNEARPQHLCLDAGYDYPVIRKAGCKPSVRPSHPQSRCRKTRKDCHSWLSSAPMGGGTNAFLAQPFSSFARPMRKENRELSGVSAPCMRSTHFC